MMIVSILISTNDLTIALGDFWTSIDLNDYIVYKLKPYLNLRVFNYYNFDNFLLPIDGRFMPAYLRQEIDSLFKQQMSTIKIMKTELMSINSLEELRKCKSGIELLELLAGKFTKKSIFYNLADGSSYIDSSTVKSIHNTPEKYILTKINLYH